MSIGVDLSRPRRATYRGTWSAIALGFGVAAGLVREPGSEVVLFVLFALLQGMWALASP